MEPRATATQIEEEVRKSLDNLVELAELLLPYCNDVGDLVGMAKLAMVNDGQLKLVMSLINAQTKKQEQRR